MPWECVPGASLFWYAYGRITANSTTLVKEQRMELGSLFTVSAGNGKTQTVRAIQFTGINFFQCAEFLGHGRDVLHNPELRATDAPVVITPIGVLPTKAGDWIVRSREFDMSYFPLSNEMFVEHFKPVAGSVPGEAEWARHCDVFPMSHNQWWVRFTGPDGIYRWLHPTENRWVEEPEQKTIPMYGDEQAAKNGARFSPEPPMWSELKTALLQRDAT